jgi:hypothetical protein
MTYAPGIYFENGPTPDRTIAMASTSLLAFVGVNIAISPAFATGELKLVSKMSDVDVLITDGADSSLLLKKVIKSYFTAGGSFCYLANVDSADFAESLAMALNRSSSISLVAFPGSATDEATYSDHYASILTYVEGRKDIVLLIDVPKTNNVAKSYADAITYIKAKTASSYASSYYPWVAVSGNDFIPPSGVIAALYGKTDNDVGVHQVAAGVQHGLITAAVGVETKISQNQHLTAVEPNISNLKLNLIRPLDGYGITVWGARTMDGGEFKHLNVRRLFIFAEQSIKNSLQWVVFEPNTKALWGSVNRSITAFLRRLWQQGALVGKKEEEAFYIKIDEENNPVSERNVGRLHIEIGLAPSHPAEFIIIKLIQSSQS